jgi:ATPase subunit of ABC transporter with duplicated ATPase domains
MSENPNEYALQLLRVSKFYERSQALKDVTLAFYAGAKIGVIGANGSGKSTMLRILAGEDLEFEGRRIVMPGRSLGYVSQEPRLDPERTVKQVLDEAVAHVRAITDRYNEICGLMGETEGEALDRLTGSSIACRPRSTRTTSGTWTSTSRWRPRRCSCRRWTASAGCCRAARRAASRCAAR